MRTREKRIYENYANKSVCAKKRFMERVHLHGRIDHRAAIALLGYRSNMSAQRIISEMECRNQLSCEKSHSTLGIHVNHNNSIDSHRYHVSFSYADSTQSTIMIYFVKREYFFFFHFRARS